MAFVLAFIIGATFGSFLNVVIDRLSTGRSIVFGRSYCENCKKTLSFLDLIPIISFVLLGGKCRYCHKKIPFRLLLVETVCGLTLSFLLWEALLGFITFASLILLAIILFSFIGIFFADIEYGIIPDWLVITGSISSFFLILVEKQSIFQHVLSAGGAVLFFFLLFAVTKGKGMGFGDVKLSFLLGLFLGFPQIVIALYMAFLTGASLSIILVIWRKVRFFGGTIPFGPFMVLSAVVAYFWGDMIVAPLLQML